MNYSSISLNGALERFQVVRPKHLAALEGILKGLSKWDKTAFFNALDALGWTERRVPLHILQAERDEWQRQYAPAAYGQVRYPVFSPEWVQEFKTSVFLKLRPLGLFAGSTGRFVYAGKKGMGLACAIGGDINHILRLVYTDFPLLHDMHKIGVGVLLISSAHAALLREAVQKQAPKTELPLLIIALA